MKPGTQCEKLSNNIDVVLQFTVIMDKDSVNNEYYIKDIIRNECICIWKK